MYKAAIIAEEARKRAQSKEKIHWGETDHPGRIHLL
jgi:hypothetical protein